MWDCISFINTAKQIQDLFSEDWNDIRPMASLRVRFPQFQGFPSWRWSPILHHAWFKTCCYDVQPQGGHFYIYLYVSRHFSSLFFGFVFTESLCSGQNICVRLCVCLPLTWTNSSSFIDVEPPRLSKQNPALNGWLYRLLWSYACHPLSFHPQNCRDPFGYIHRHTCARPLYTKLMCAV